MIWRPRCIMNPVMEPALPRVMIVPPFWSIPVRAPTWPLTTRSPPRIAAPGQRAGVGLDHDDAGHHVLARRPAHAPGDVDLRPVDHAQGEVAQGPVEAKLATGEDARSQGMLGAGIEHRDVGDALLIEQPPQLQVDPPGGHVARVERRLVAVDLGDLRDAGVELDQPAGVEHRLLRGRRLFHRVHTITVLS